MAMYLPNTLEAMVRNGANITIESGNYLPQTIINLLIIARKTGSKITISGNFLPNTLEEFAKVGGNNLTLIVNKN